MELIGLNLPIGIYQSSTMVDGDHGNSVDSNSSMESVDDVSPTRKTVNDNDF
jgi:hypothetical protein